MTKRKLTQRQLAQQRRNQAERVTRLQNVEPQDTLNQSLGHEQPGLLIAHYGTTAIIENQAQALIRCGLRQNLGPLATGDRIVWQAIDDQSGIITAVLPRDNIIMKATQHGLKPFVANTTQIVIVIAPEPKPQPTTIDRYMVFANHENLEVLLVVNKCDILEETAHPHLIEQCEWYEKLGYNVLKVSSKTHVGMDELVQKLKDKRSILVGQSGVGKSSLLTALVPTAQVRIQTLSALHRTGRHTTTACRLFHLPQGGDLIDSPGTNQLRIHHLSPTQIIEGFREFKEHAHRCQFRDCKHQQAKGCALQLAMDNEGIPADRLVNLRKLLIEAEEAL